MVDFVWNAILALQPFPVYGRTDKRDTGKDQNPVDQDVVQFALLLVLTGTALTLMPEFFYLIDQFGWRMNTIFKFSFEAWIVGPLQRLLDRFSSGKVFAPGQAGWFLVSPGFYQLPQVWLILLLPYQIQPVTFVQTV